MMRRRKRQVGLFAGWIAIGVLTSQQYSFRQCGAMVAECLLLATLAMFVWLIVGASIGLVVHYWTKA